MAKSRKKKRVIAYVHSHWDREWYREFEVFRLRLLRVFDNVLNMLKDGRLPSFYFDGQVIALLDYLDMRPENEVLIRDLIAEKKLFIGPFYTLVDEFLTDRVCFSKNLEIGMSVAKYFGCNDFIGYFADTFGHSKNIPDILKEYGINKSVVWRGVPDKLPSEFIYNGVNTVNLVRGYFDDIFASDKTIEEKAQFLKSELDKIAQKSGKTLLLPIGADHLGVPGNINEQINEINNLLEDYKIELGSIFDYFKSVKFKVKYNEELRDNSNTFILPGSYSARIKLKQLNVYASYILDIANKLQLNFDGSYNNVIDYAYRLLLQNQAHDGICGCSTDKVHEENVVRYNKVIEIAQTVIEEIRYSQQENISASFKFHDKYKILEVESDKMPEIGQVVDSWQDFPSKILYNTLKIPVTEDYTTIYKYLREYKNCGEISDLSVTDNCLKNFQVCLEVSDGQINLRDGRKIYKNFVEFVRYKDNGDTYNYGPIKGDKGEKAEIKSSRVIMDGPLRCAIKIDTSFFGVIVFLNKKSKLLNFKITWSNLSTNKLWQVRFNLKKAVKTTQSEDFNTLVKRQFDPEYNIRENLPKAKGIEAKTNTAPMQRFVWANGFGVITKGLCEYEVFQNTLSVTMLRSIGIISNPNNPARTTPAGPPIKVPGAQQFGVNTAEFAIGFFDIKDWDSYVEEIYPQTIIL